MLSENQIVEKVIGIFEYAESADARLAVAYYKDAWHYLKKSEAPSLSPMKVICLEGLIASFRAIDGWSEKRKAKNISKYQLLLRALLQKPLSPTAIKAKSAAETLFGLAEGHPARTALTYYQDAWEWLESINEEGLLSIKQSCLQGLIACIQARDGWNNEKKRKKITKYQKKYEKALAALSVTSSKKPPLPAVAVDAASSSKLPPSSADFSFKPIKPVEEAHPSHNLQSSDASTAHTASGLKL